MLFVTALKYYYLLRQTLHSSVTIALFSNGCCSVVCFITAKLARPIITEAPTTPIQNLMETDN